MLIEFSVANFRSFRERQTLSMVAAPRLRRRENVFRLDLEGESLPGLLKVVAIYGPNASGKSNLVRAFDAIGRMVRRTPSDESLLPVAPFRFDKDLAGKPSQFELHFACAGIRYELQLSALPERIVEEKLIAYPRGKESLLYSRVFNGESDEYVFGDRFEGGRELHQVWRRLTGPRLLFISQAVANSNEDIKQLRPPLDWLRHGLNIIEDNDMGAWAGASQRLAQQHSKFTDDISTFLRDIDIPISSIGFEQSESELFGDLISDTGDTGSQLGWESSGRSLNGKMLLKHNTALGNADFTFEEESRGTRNLIGFWLPWSVHGLEIHGTTFGTLVVDEMDSSLHPEIVVSLVDRHIRSPIEKQLILTTHDTHLMDSKLMRRDQFWVVDRDVNGATKLRSIYDFEGREGEDIEKRYFEGRYRGLPVLRNN